MSLPESISESSCPQDRQFNRRRFALGALGAGALAMGLASGSSRAAAPSLLRLGAPVGAKDPDSWIATLKSKGYRAAYCPVGPDASDDAVKSYEEAARKADIIISETGAWSNPLSADETERKAAQEKCRAQLALADRIGARCCVNISGSRGKDWAGHDPKNLTDETFDMIVEITRSIIDDVKPTRSFFTLEAMAWAYPHTPDAYVRLLKAIDRKQFAVHLDPTNMVCSPEIYYSTGDLIRECFKKLGPQIRSCHAKDAFMSQQAIANIVEIIPGKGYLDYSAFIQELRRYPEVPLMLEHLSSEEEYDQAAAYIRSVDAKV